MKQRLIEESKEKEQIQRKEIEVLKSQINESQNKQMEALKTQMLLQVQKKKEEQDSQARGLQELKNKIDQEKLKDKGDFAAQLMDLQNQFSE